MTACECVFLFFLLEHMQPTKKTQTLFLKAYCIYGDTHFCLFHLFFNEISLLYVYSLNKSDTVCNALIPVVCCSSERAHVELHSRFLTLETAVDKTILIAEEVDRDIRLFCQHICGINAFTYHETSWHAGETTFHSQAGHMT